MSTPWLKALKNIPWGSVMEHAPKVLDKARNFMTSKEAEDIPASSAEATSPAEVEVQLANALVSIKKLQQQLEGLNLKISHLADQQSLLKSEVQSLKVRDRWQKATILVLLVGAAIYYSTPYFKA